MMVKKSKKASKLAPLERDVEPNLRKLTFVRARYAHASHFVHRRHLKPGCPLAIESKDLSPRMSAIELSVPPPTRRDGPPPPVSQRLTTRIPHFPRPSRRPDPPLISDDAMKKMIVLDAEKRGAPSFALRGRRTEHWARGERKHASARRTKPAPAQVWDMASLE